VLARLHRRDRAGATRFSALKVGGKAAYARARAGEEVELEGTAGDVIHDLHLLGSDANSATLSATVSKGTYIRSLAATSRAH
jgi:tRNA pseudouridine55 synthase